MAGRLRLALAYGSIPVAGMAALGLLAQLPIRDLAAMLGSVVIWACTIALIAVRCSQAGPAGPVFQRVHLTIKAMPLLQGIWLSFVAERLLLVAGLYLLAEYALASIMIGPRRSTDHPHGRPTVGSLLISATLITLGILVARLPLHLLSR